LLYQEVIKTGSTRVIFKKYVESFNAIGLTWGKDDIKHFFEIMDISVTRPTPYVNTFARFVMFGLDFEDEKLNDEDILQFIDDVKRCAKWKREYDDDDKRSISSDEELSFKNNLGLGQSLLPRPSHEYSLGSGAMPAYQGSPAHQGQLFSHSSKRPSVTSGSVAAGNHQQQHTTKLVQIGPQVPMTKITLNNQKLVSVRHRLMKFAVFGTINKRGFEGFNDHAFKFSSSREAVNPSQACRLNTTQARGPSAWVPDMKSPNSDNTFHVIVTLGADPKDLYAVAMQGRADKDEWVVHATILVSLDGVSWKNLPTVHTFSCTDRNSVVVYPLYSPARCKYVKLRVEKWHNKPSLRWDCLAV